MKLINRLSMIIKEILIFINSDYRATSDYRFLKKSARKICF